RPTQPPPRLINPSHAGFPATSCYRRPAQTVIGDPANLRLTPPRQRRSAETTVCAQWPRRSVVVSAKALPQRGDPAEGAAEATAPHHIVALSTVSAHVPRHGTTAAAAHRTRDNRSMSNAAYVSDPPSPNFPLKQPGTAVIHAGPRQEPRILSVASRCAEHMVELAEDTDLFAFL